MTTHRPDVDPLADTETRLRLVLDATRTGTFIWHADPDRTEADRRMLELFGLSPGEPLSLADALGRLIHPADTQRYAVAVAAALDPDGPGVLRQDIRVCRPDGSQRWILVTGQVEPIGSGVGGPRMFGTATDITDRKRVEAEREALLDRERERRESAEAFVAVMSHELRTPVTSIFGAASLLLKDPGRAEVVEFSKGLIEDAERLLRIVDDLIVLSGAERGLVALESEPVLLQRAVDTVLSMVRRRFPDVTFTTDMSADLPAIFADPTAVRQVLDNVLTNAAKYAGAAGPVHVGVSAGEGTVEVTILDEGPGPGDDPERLFTLFYRDPAAAISASGTGIGLYVVRELVRAMGGTVHASARVTGGSCFRIVFPAAEDPELS